MVDAMKIAKLRAKAISTSYPQEAAMFDRKAGELAAANGIADADIERALAEILGATRHDPHRRHRRPDTRRRRVRRLSRIPSSPR